MFPALSVVLFQASSFSKSCFRTVPPSRRPFNVDKRRDPENPIPAIKFVGGAALFIDKPLRSNDVGQTHIPVSFAIPFDCFPTTITFANDTECDTTWSLRVKVKDQGSSGGAQFEVPVFVTPESRSDFQFDDELVEPFVEQTDPLEVLERCNMIRSPKNRNQQSGILDQASIGGSSEFSLSFSIWDRSTFWAMVVLMVLSSLWIVAAWRFSPSWPIFGIAVFIPFFLLGISIYGMVELFFWQSRLEVEKTMLICSSGYSGFGRKVETPRDLSTRILCVVEHRTNSGEKWCLQIQSPSIADLENKDSESLSSQVEEKLPFQPVQETPVTIVRKLNGRMEAEAIQAWLAREIGVSIEKPQLTVLS